MKDLAKFKLPSVIQALNFKDALSDYHREILMWTRWGQQRANSGLENGRPASVLGAPGAWEEVIT